MEKDVLSAEDIEWQKVTLEHQLAAKNAAKVCTKEEDHKFDSTGECHKCGSHRTPYRPS